MKMQTAKYLVLLSLMTAVLSTLQCSTYFNTFYNAETSFGEGYKLHEKVMKSYPDSLLVTPPPEARAKYDRAIAKSRKVLDTFPKDKKWHDDALLMLGKSYYYEKEAGAAIRRLRQLQQEYPQSPLIPESYLYLAKAYISDDNLPKAEETLKFALDRYPFLDKDHKISLLLIEIEIRHEGKSRAISLLEQVRSSVRSGQLQIDLLLRVANLYMGMEQFDKAIALLKKAPRDRKFPLQEYRIDRDLVSCYVAIDSLEKATKLLAAMRANKLYLPYMKEILYVNGVILARMGKTDEAIAVFKQVIGSADSNTIKSDTSKLIGKAWFELGQIYQKRKSNYKEAQKYYKLVAERTIQDSQVTPVATARMKAMTAIADLRKKIAARDTTVKKSAGLYEVGELFLYDLDEPDSACFEFCRLTGDTLVDSLFPKAMLAAAQIKGEKLKDTARADSLYRLLIARFPGTGYSRCAQEKLRSPEIVKTRGEQSLEAFMEAEKVYFFDSDPKAAVQAYYNVYKKYPDLDVGPKSLYAAAWITDSELRKKKVAKSLYEKICERYPESVYCKNEARPRIKVVLDTLEALRRENRGGESSILEPKAADSSKLAAGASPGSTDSAAAAAQAAVDSAGPNRFPGADSLSTVRKMPGTPAGADSTAAPVSPQPQAPLPGNSPVQQPSGTPEPPPNRDESGG